MGDIAIRTENLSKLYRIGEYRGNYETLRESIVNIFSAPFRYLSRNPQTSNLNTQSNCIWALKDISFEVKRGEVVGIIGRNGAGKTTLLKILSRITEPTEGWAKIRGRVGSLLEVGTGFHPELTGRENIYLNGAILGMKKDELKRKFDEIVAFAEVEKFIDTPVKRYSSGMYVRLAFAVAAHLEPEILLVDEVLAVGDLSFQQKCLNHIRSLTARGMTILLISHNMAAIQSSCGRAFLLENGKIVARGEPVEVIRSYRNSLKGNCDRHDASLVSLDDDSRSSASGVTIVGFEMFGEDGVSRRDFEFNEAIRIRIDLHATQRIQHPVINFGIKRGDGVIVCNFNNWYDNFRIDYIEGECSFEGWLPPLRLVPDFYAIHVLVWPWGGGHLQGDMTRLVPFAWATFGDFRIRGPGLNSHDGVFQMAAQKWSFRRRDHLVEYTGMTPTSLYEVFAEGGTEAG